jgi:hypothetical protein
MEGVLDKTCRLGAKLATFKITSANVRPKKYSNNDYVEIALENT